MPNRCRRIHLLYIAEISEMIAHTCPTYLIRQPIFATTATTVTLESLSDGLQIIESRQVAGEITVLQKRKVDLEKSYLSHQVELSSTWIFWISNKRK